MENESSSPYRQSLIESGLTVSQAAIYETLVQKGALPASKVAFEAKLGRPLAYKVLDELSDLGLVEKQDAPRSVARFAAAHPIKLKELADKRFQEAQNAKQSLDGALSKLISDFNLQSGKPGVRFFEGTEGVREVAWDTLTTKGELRMIADVAAIRRFIPEINAEYVAERKKRNIKKRTLVLDTHGMREYYQKSVSDITDTRLIHASEAPFQSDMHIYDGKVSYITFSEERLIGFIISDPHVYATHRYLFDFMWDKAEIIQVASAIGAPSDSNTA